MAKQDTALAPEETKKTKGKSTTKLTDEFTKASEFGGYLEFLGRSGGQVRRTAKKVERLGAKLKERGIDINEFDINDEFTPEDTGRFRGQFDKKGKDDKKPSKARLFKQTQAAQGRERVDESQAFLDEDIEPKFEEAQALLDDLLASPAFSPKFLADSRSNIAGQIKQAEESRLSRIGASLGLRGLAPGSPVAAALADQAAEESDQFLVDQLRQQDMQAEQIEQSSQLMEIQAQQSLAQSRIASRNAAIQGDRDRLAQINNEIAGTFQAIQTQRELLKIMDELGDTGGGFGFAEGLGITGGVVGGIYGGPAGAAAGSQIGSAVGGGIDNATSDNPSGSGQNASNIFGSINSGFGEGGAFASKE